MSNTYALQIPNPPLEAPALTDAALRYSYTIGRGETGVLSFEPYKSFILPFWRFRTFQIAQDSAEVLWAIFESYCQRGDFIGADMTRKFIQMGMTRAKRYANHKGGRKFGPDGEPLAKWTGEDGGGKRREKEQASEVFKVYWRRCTSHTRYLGLKGDWMKAKREHMKTGESGSLET